MRASTIVVVSFLAAVLAEGCSRGGSPAQPAADPLPAPAPLLPPPGPTAAAPTRPAPVPGVVPVVPVVPAPPASPRDQETATNYTLVAAIGPVTAPADTTFTLELHGAGGYHVNEQYPIQVDLDVQNLTAAKTTLRRADASEYAQAGARFSLPVHTTAPGATIRGRVRFAVCSAENCVPETRQFAVALP